MHSPKPRLPPTHHPVITTHINSWLDPSKQSWDTFFYKLLLEDPNSSAWMESGLSCPAKLTVFSSGSSKQIAEQLYTVLLLSFHNEVATSLEFQISAMRCFQFFIRFLRNFRIICFFSRKSILSALLFSSLVALHFCCASPQVFFFNLFIACFSWLILTFHFSLLVLYDLLFPFFFFFSVMAALPVVLLWGPEFPLANETKAAYLPCFCSPAVSFLKHKLIFIQWSSCAGSDPLRGDCILWQREGG